MRRRTIAVLVQLALFAWNAPAMALPALIQQTVACLEPASAGDGAPPTAAAAQAHTLHHHGMRHGPAMPVAPSARFNVGDCFQQHTCCGFNREPGRKSEPASLSDASAAAQRAPEGPARCERAGTRGAEALPPARAVFDLKSDMRI